MAKRLAVNTAIIRALGGVAGRGDAQRLAEATGRDASTVSRWFNMQSSPEPDVWPAIERELGLEDGELQRAVVTTLDDDVLRRVERLEQGLLMIARRLSESLEGDAELSALADALESERTARQRAAR